MACSLNWWGKQSAIPAAVLDEFKVQWGEPWYEFRVVEFEANRKMVWECIDASQIIKGLEGVQKNGSEQGFNGRPDIFQGFTEPW